MDERIKDPPVYLPFMKGGVYDMKIGLHPLSTDFGNKLHDSKIIQIDCNHQNCMISKHLKRAKTPLYLTADLSQPIRVAAIDFIKKVLVKEYPWYFSIVKHEQDQHHTFHCVPTSDYIFFTTPSEVRHSSIWTRMNPTDGLDALCHLIQEDVAIVTVWHERNWLAMLHVAHPSGWNPKEKIGRDFKEVHRSVPEMETIKNAQAGLMKQMTKSGPFVRFVWGFKYDHECPDRSHLWVERQTTCPLDGVTAWMFFIKVYKYGMKMLQKREGVIPRMREALVSMTGAQKEYKGYVDSFLPTLSYLEKFK